MASASVSGLQQFLLPLPKRVAFHYAISIGSSKFPAVVKQLCNLRLLGKSHYIEIASGVKHCLGIS